MNMHGYSEDILIQPVPVKVHGYSEDILSQSEPVDVHGYSDSIALSGSVRKFCFMDA